MRTKHTPRIVMRFVVTTTIVATFCLTGCGAKNSPQTPVTVQTPTTPKTPRTPATPKSPKAPKTPATPATAQKTTAPAKGADVQTVADFLQRRIDIEVESQNDPRYSGSMAEMRRAGSDHLEKLQTLLRDLYNYLDSVPSVNSSALKKSQEAWEAEIRDKYDEMESEFSESPYSGNMYGMELSGAGLEATNARLDSLFALAYEHVDGGEAAVRALVKPQGTNAQTQSTAAQNEEPQEEVEEPVEGWWDGWYYTTLPMFASAWNPELENARLDGNSFSGYGSFNAWGGGPYSGDRGDIYEGRREWTFIFADDVIMEVAGVGEVDEEGNPVARPLSRDRFVSILENPGNQELYLQVDNEKVTHVFIVAS